MRTLVLLCALLLAAPASANSLEDAFCQKLSTPVPQMVTSEKFCRSFARALHKLPEATTDEFLTLLSPENIALMAAMTATWAGTQGVPVVGQAVDAAVLALGVILLTAQSAALADALWRYADQTFTARSHAELDAAANHLSRAISTAGINIVAFILTKKTLGKGRPGPLSPSPGMVTARGSVISPLAMEVPPSALAPALMMGSAAPPPKAESQQEQPAKNPDGAAFEQWIQQAPRRPTRSAPEAYRYQQRQAGPEEFQVTGGGEQVWADGSRTDTARLVEVKFIESPDKSPFIPGSKCNENVRRWVHQELHDEFRRYAAVILDSRTPAVALEVVTNDARAVPLFESLLRSFNIPGEVLVRP